MDLAQERRTVPMATYLDFFFLSLCVIWPFSLQISIPPPSVEMFPLLSSGESKGKIPVASIPTGGGQDAAPTTPPGRSCPCLSFLQSAGAWAPAKANLQKPRRPAGRLPDPGAVATMAAAPLPGRQLAASGWGGSREPSAGPGPPPEPLRASLPSRSAREVGNGTQRLAFLPEQTLRPGKPGGAPAVFPFRIGLFGAG